MENNQNNTNNITVIVLGMHRSGTSMVGGLLNILNVDMEHITNKKSFFNIKGYFEDQQFKKLNDKILKYNNSSWDLPSKYLQLKTSDFLNKKIKNILQNKKNIWGLERSTNNTNKGIIFTAHIKSVFYYMLSQ